MIKSRTLIMRSGLGRTTSMEASSTTPFGHDIQTIVWSPNSCNRWARWQAGSDNKFGLVAQTGFELKKAWPSRPLLLTKSWAMERKKNHSVSVTSWSRSSGVAEGSEIKELSNLKTLLRWACSSDDVALRALALSSSPWKQPSRQQFYLSTPAFSYLVF